MDEAVEVDTVGGESVCGFPVQVIGSGRCSSYGMVTAINPERMSAVLGLLRNEADGGDGCGEAEVLRNADGGTVGGRKGKVMESSIRLSPIDSQKDRSRGREWGVGGT